LRAARQNGGRVAFDGNYRPRGWGDAATARRAFNDILPLVDLALPTLEDEQALFADADAACCIARLKDAGIKEIIVKRGPLGCLIDAEGGFLDIPPQKVVRPVDTTAAGDSFNAGYLAARIGGASPIEAARTGHRLAGIVILSPGAVIVREAMPKDILKTGAYS
jgi:2-dehydro-3-deoxygluconokinase